MNERLKTFYDQIGLDFENFQRVTVTKSDMEKFAELIIKECVQFIEEENVRLCEYQNSLPEWEGNKRDDCDLVIEKCIDLAERMKTHFGVEE